MDYPEQYKAQILSAIQSIDLVKVNQVIQVFKGARAHGRRIFVCGNGGIDSVVAQLLCDLVKGARSSRAPRFRIAALSDQLPNVSRESDKLTADSVFVEQLKNFAEPEDVVMGICPTGNAPNVVNAIEYASWIGCRTIGVTGYDGGKVGRLADLNVQVPVTHAGGVEDAHVIICHMIGHYFVDLERAG
jgi:D-sedoheptulose 7-phosphate isomerase